MADTDKREPERSPSWQTTSWAQMDVEARLPLRSRLWWPIVFGATALLIALVLVGLGLSFAQQARANKQVRYDVPNIGNSQPGHSHAGPLLAFIPPVTGAVVIGERAIVKPCGSTWG